MWAAYNAAARYRDVDDDYADDDDGGRVAVGPCEEVTLHSGMFGRGELWTWACVVGGVRWVSEDVGAAHPHYYCRPTKSCGLTRFVSRG